MDSNVKLIDAHAMKSNSNQKRQIMEYINEIIIGINKELKEARLNGAYYIITELPIIFDINHMSNANAQRTIYSKIIEILRGKNFTVRINHTNNSCLLKISWFTVSEENEIQKQLQLIKECHGSF
jgi:hypothetical protein